MEEERIVRAMARIEAAARRIEAASSTMPSAASLSAGVITASNGLAEKHERLRREAWAALAELDSLIEAIEA